MSIDITFVYAYFENATMFELQQSIWLAYPKEVRKHVEFIVTDDCSTDHPARKYLVAGDLNLSLYEIKKKIQWNWLECRNIGAYHARGKWLLLTDMDHVVSFSVVEQLLNRLPGLDTGTVYQFNRVKAPNMDWYKFHNDSFFLTKKLFWKSGGYDEAFSGLYGTSGMFRDRLLGVAEGRRELFDNLSLILYGREVVPDASTTCYARKEGRDPNVLKDIKRKKIRTGQGILLFQRPFIKVK